MSELSDAEPVGRVVGMWRYPVKSMGPEALDEANVAWDGVAGDRRWAFIRPNLLRSGFPWLTLRQCPTMAHYSPFFTDPSHPDRSPTVVQTPSGAVLDVDDPALAAELCDGARLIRQNRGVFDTFPLSLITTQTIARLEEMTAERLDVQRFRPNLLVEASEDSPFAEDRWVGRVLRIGGLRMRVDSRDSRCVVITIDPSTMARNPAVLRTVTEQRAGCLGVYGTTVKPGLLSVNDEVYVEAA